MSNNNRRDNQFLQGSLFGEEVAEVAVDDKLRERQIRDRQAQGQELSLPERQEAEGLVELAEFLSLLRLRSTRVMKQA